LSTTAAAFPSSPFLHDNRNIKQKLLISKISCDSDYIKNNLNRKIICNLLTGGPIKAADSLLCTVIMKRLRSRIIRLFETGTMLMMMVVVVVVNVRNWSI
jgi:hypothetical protein